MVQVWEHMPPPRQSTNFLRPLAHLLVDALGLEPPTTLDPGHWKTPDGFITVSTSLIKDGFTDRGTPLRALIAFEPRDAQQKAKKNIQARYPDYERMPPEERRGVWGKILLMTKEARKERVAEIVAELDRHGVDLPAHNIVVHRVSNTFFATVNLEILEQIQALRRAHGYDELRRINIEKPAVF